MPEWYQRPYPGKQAVPLPGFPRPLHFPGNSGGYPASADGDDVLAYKRAVSRLGRWPWEPDEWDHAYSKNFALGKGPNVRDSGILGVQRQMPALGDTGYVGEDFFQFLRCARIPVGLPNSGQPAMDATCQNLLAMAWKEFKGKDKPDVPVDVVSRRQQALKKAITQLGVKESPRNSNHTMYGQWYGVDYQPWCAMFATWCFLQGGPHSTFVRGSRYSYVPYIVLDAWAGRYGLSVTRLPIPGDLVCYDFNGGEYDHVGIFEAGDSRSWAAIEGNTGFYSNSNGGEVMRRQRSIFNVNRVRFVRVREPAQA